MGFWDRFLLGSIGLVSLGILGTSRVPSQSNTNNPSVLGGDCIPLEIVNKHRPNVGIDSPIQGQFYVNGRLTKATLNTTKNCVQGLPPKTIDALKRAQQRGQ
jgi:hypothetical protein